VDQHLTGVMVVAVHPANLTLALEQSQLAQKDVC
jgi:hypothetical protein